MLCLFIVHRSRHVPWIWAYIRIQKGTLVKMTPDSFFEENGESWSRWPQIAIPKIHIKRRKNGPPSVPPSRKGIHLQSVLELGSWESLLCRTLKKGPQKAPYNPKPYITRCSSFHVLFRSFLQNSSHRAPPPFSHQVREEALPRRIRADHQPALGHLRDATGSGKGIGDI